MTPIIRWPDQTLPVEIYCAPDVLKELEILATDGLLAMPRIGLGVGGLLLGRREGDRIEILRAMPIPCSHATGPAFVLTGDEIAAAAKMNGDADVERVGWYCSKPAGQTAPSRHDLELLDVLCPEAWQLSMFIRPRLGKVSTAAFGSRKGGGEGFWLGASQDIVWRAPEAPETGPEAMPEEQAPVSVPVVSAPVVPAPAIDEPVDGPIPVQVPHDSTLFGVPQSGTLFGVPQSGTLFGVPQSGTLFGVPETAEPRQPRSWPRRLLLTVSVFGFLVAAAWLTRDYWLPSPPVAMMALSDRMGRVSFLWNPEGLLRNPESILTPLSDYGAGATLVIDDGPGPLHTIHLNPKEARAGWFQFDCRPGRIIATLLAGEMSDTVTLTARVEAPYLPESGISK